MNYDRMAQEYLEEVGRLNRRLDQLREEARLRRESDLWQRVGQLMEIRDDLRVTAHVLQRKVMEYGAPIPWKRIVAELGNHWTVGKARYAYSRVCALCFAPRKRKGECHGLYCKTMPLPWNLPGLREKGERGGLPAGGMSLSDPPAAACGGRDAPPHPGAEPHPRTAAGTSGVKAGVCPPAGPQGRDGLPAEGG